MESFRLTLNAFWMHKNVTGFFIAQCESVIGDDDDDDLIEK